MRRGREKFGRILPVLSLLLFFAVFLTAFLPAAVYAEGEEYLCVWEDGSESTERYADAFASLAALGSGGIVLERAGVRGTIGAGEALLGAVRVLEEGNLAELYTLRVSGCNRLERAALFRTYSKRVYYSGEGFAFTGERVLPVTKPIGEELVLLEGSITPAALRDTGAKKLTLRADASVTAETMRGAFVEEVCAEYPYDAEGGAVYLNTVGGKRLVAAVPALKELAVADCDYCDGGALRLLDRIEKLSLPFVGNAENSLVSDYDGTLLSLFRSSGGGIPSSLGSLTVRGGELRENCFYGSALKEINACGVDPASIDRSAFYLPSLEKLHAPAEDAILAGEFVCRKADCGCFVYERISGGI